MGKRNRHRNGHKNGRKHHHHPHQHQQRDNRHPSATPFRKEPFSVKHKPPQKDVREKRHQHESSRDKERIRHEIGTTNQSSLPLFNAGMNNGTTFSSRKRSLMAVEFVYPKKDGKKETYRFEKGNNKKSEHTTNENQIDHHDSTNESQPAAKKSIDEILYPNRRRSASEDSSSSQRLDASSSATNGKRRASFDETSNSSAEGHLSGRSVEDAVRDLVGCRPRSNSTDGELNLPQRGLCDERTVLESYRWRFDRCDIDGGEQPKGFNNLGNTCYLNSTLQCLAHVPPFCQSLLTLTSKSSSSQGGRGPSQGKRITLMLKSLFTRVHASNGAMGSSIAPRQIVNSVPALSSIGSRGGYRFRPGRQEDCHEFLVHLLDAMNDGELREAGINQHKSGWRDRLPIARLDETTFIHRTFGGYFRSQVRCNRCDYKSNTYDPFLDLSLEISKPSCHSILDALRDFTRKEKLDNENRWKCSGCKKLVCATKQLTVFRPPLSLCIQLKRFAFSGGFLGFGGFGGGKKISKPIDFPPILKLPLSDARSCQYSLTGIVIHLGGSATSGHYTACIKKPSSDGKSHWFHMDDSFVEPISERAVLRQRDAYLLFYSREEVKIEYPTPPLRGSMSAEEAKELGRNRSIARGLKTMESPETNTAVAPNKSTKDDVVTKAAPSAKARNAEIEKDGEMKMSAEPKTNESEEASDSSSSDDSDEDSSDSEESTDGNDRKVKATQVQLSKQGKDVSTKTSNDATSHKDKSQTTLKSPPSEGSTQTSKEVLPDNKVNTKIEKPKDHKQSAPQHQDDSADTSSDSSDDSSSSSSDSSSDDEKEDNVGTTRSEPAPVEEEKKKETGPSNGDSSSSPSESSSEDEKEVKAGKTGSDRTHNQEEKKEETDPSSGEHLNRTKISLDRGDGREKISVMLGPRFKGRGWTPGASTVTTSKGRDFDLLGNVAVSKWDDEDEDEAVVASKESRRAAVVASMTKQEKTRKKRMYLDSWDAALDRGRTKKVKGAGKDNAHKLDSQNIRFQRIQASVQKMNRGRAKGLFRNGGRGGGGHKKKGHR